MQQQLQHNLHEIALVCIELSDNAAGGASGHGIALVIDATRMLENAQYLLEHEPEQAGKTLWSIARELLSHADVVLVSLARDFCIDTGGLIATNYESLLHKIQALMEQQGGGLPVIERKLIAHTLRQRR